MERIQPDYIPQKFIPQSIDQIRNFAKTLKGPLADYNIEIPHMSLLHIISRAMGYENYNTAKALLVGSTKRAKQPVTAVLEEANEPYIFNDENFSRFMYAVRRVIGDGMFEHIMRIHSYKPSGAEPETLLGLFMEYGIISNEDLAAICANELSGENIVYEGAEYWKKYDVLNDGSIIPKGAQVDQEEMVACFWPRKGEGRKQLIIPYVTYLKDLITSSDMAYRRTQTFKAKQAAYLAKRIAVYSAMAKDRNIPKEQYDPEAITDRMPTGPEEAMRIASIRYDQALRSLMISGLEEDQAKKIARWATMYLWLDRVDLNSFVAEHFDHAFLKKFRNDTSGKLAREYAAYIIYVHFIAKSGLPVSREEWEVYVLTDTGRNTIMKMLKEYRLMRLADSSLAVIFNKSLGEAMGALAETSMRNAVMVSLAEIEDVLQAGLDEAEVASFGGE